MSLDRLKANEFHLKAWGKQFVVGLNGINVNTNMVIKAEPKTVAAAFVAAACEGGVPISPRLEQSPFRNGTWQ